MICLNDTRSHKNAHDRCSVWMHIPYIWFARGEERREWSLAPLGAKAPPLTGGVILKIAPPVSVEPPTGSPLVFIYSQEFNYIHIQFENQNVVLSILTIYCLIVQVARMITRYKPLIFNKQNLPYKLFKI